MKRVTLLSLLLLCGSCAGPSSGGESGAPDAQAPVGSAGSIVADSLPRDACATEPGDEVTCPAASGPADVLAVPSFDANLDAASYAAWRDHVLPDAGELAWATIPWKPTFAEGLHAADAEGKPLLMWAMNGHPLGCT